jgi:tetratricopeptide (TPR) repeat protein
MTPSGHISAVLPEKPRRKRGLDRRAPERKLPARQSTARTLYTALLLVGFTFILYSPVRRDTFLTYDDYGYVVNNPHVSKGLSWQTLRWSLTSSEQTNWHPVTWLSHALDCQLFGLNASGHHLVNVVLHTLNVLLLFFLLQRATGAVGRSFVVAALFAWHPFNVQSVAWIAERKNVLSTLFFLLALGAYGWYARNPRFKRFVLVVTFFLLALASKPMAVTFPFVVLLLDYWPLGRVQGWNTKAPGFEAPVKPLRLLLLEKLPLFALSAASCAITLWAQKTVVAASAQLPFGLRLENALRSYAIYVWKAFWPLKLAVFYPHPGASLSLWKPVLASLLLAAVSLLAWRGRRVHPYLIVGWLWFLGTLVPVIGIVQVGAQAMADRYAYVPLIGIFLMAVWAAADFFDKHTVPTAWRWALVSIVLGGLAYRTYRELSYWQDNTTIWSHALEVTEDDPQVETNFGNALVLLGDPSGALPHLVKAGASDTEDVVARENLGVCFLAEGRIPDAIHEFEAVVQLTDSRQPDKTDHEFWEFRSSALLNLGVAYTLSRDYSRALTSFRGANLADTARVSDVIEKLERAIASTPAESDFLTLSLLLSAKGRETEASSILHNAITTDPNNEATRGLLSYLDSSSR